MPKRIFLTIRGVSRSISEWTRQPGAMSHSTITARIQLMGWTPERAVFTPSLRRLREGTVRVRLVGVNRASRGLTDHLKRPAVVLAPNPKVANPHPPTWGRYSSWPIEALELLRRCA